MERVKEGSDVEIDNPVLLKAPLSADRDRVHGRAPGTIAIGILGNTGSTPGSNAIVAAVSATLSTTFGIPSTLIPPLLPFLGISTARTGPGKYDPDDIRFHSR